MDREKKWVREEEKEVAAEAEAKQEECRKPE